MKKSILSAALLLVGVMGSSAAVTAYSWIRLGEGGNVFADASGTAHPFGAGFSSGCCCGAGGGGIPAAVLSSSAAGGPLGITGSTSTISARWGFYTCANSGMWIQGANNTVPTPAQWSLPATNWVMECWVLPVNDARSGGALDQDGAVAQFMSTGTSHFGGTPRGAAFRTTYDLATDTVIIRAHAIGPDATNNFPIGEPIVSDKKRWIHVAVVNANGVFTFYTNGVASGASTNYNTGDIVGTVPYIGSGIDTGQPFDGYLDECRYSTFAPGAFSTNDLLLIPSGPRFISQPESTTAWVGGTAPFRVVTAYDATTTYQWRRGSSNITGATNSLYVQSNVTLGDSGALFDVVVAASSISKTSSVATLTVIQNNPSNVGVYRTLVTNEPSLLAYFPVDNNTGATLTNVKDATRNGTLELNAIYDGRTNRAFGQRAVSFYGDGDVAIPGNPAFEFPSGNGTIEVLVYLDPTALFNPTDGTIFSQTADGGTPNYYFFRTGAGGTSIVYGNDATTQLSWEIPGGLVSKQTHVAIVFNDLTNVTLYANGENLGTKVQTSFGSGSGTPAWIGSMGTTATANWFSGAVDELSIYGSALSQNTVQVHYSAYFFGTNTAPPSIVSQSASKTLYAGASPVLTATVSGTLPISYGWKSNGVPIPGANSLNLVLSNATVNATYTLSATNNYGTTDSLPIVLTFVAPPTGYAVKVMQDAPSAFWRLSETNGPAVDWAGGNDGTYSSSVNRSVAGAFTADTNQAAHFSGGGSPVPNVIVPFSPTLNPVGPFTIEFWAKPNTSGNAGRSVVGNQNRNTGRAGYVVYQGFNVNGWEGHVGFGDTVLFIQGVTPPVAGRWDHVVLAYDGTSVARIYVNGVDDTSAGSTTGGPNRANLSVPFEIGSRFGSGVPYPGTVDEVAFYNYRLSATQISNHWTFSWLPSSISQQPTSVTSNEWSTVALTVVAAGYPNTYQWHKVGSGALTDVNNFDGTRHYPNGVTNATLIISQTHPVDSGQYFVVVSNPLAGSQSQNATVSITAETTPPTVAFASALPTPNSSGPTPFLVRVTFNEPVDAATAAVPGNYVINGGASVGSVILSADSKSAFLSTSGLTSGQSYTILISGVKDQAQTPNTIVASTPASVWAPVISQGLVWDFYVNIIPSTLVELLASPYYPKSPYTNINTTGFDSTPITGGDLNNRPGFVGIGGNYGASLSGWITPTVTTNYYFFIASDDGSELQLSSDANPANAALIAAETGCCNPFREPELGFTATSAAIPLTNGVSYFIRALQIEGGGGDYVRVAWKMQEDPTPAASLLPISGSVLSSYGPLPAPQFGAPVLAGNQLTISWTGGGTLFQSTDLVNWSPVPGNPPGLYVVNVTSAPRLFYRVVR